MQSDTSGYTKAVSHNQMHMFMHVMIWIRMSSLSGTLKKVGHVMAPDQVSLAIFATYHAAWL